MMLLVSKAVAVSALSVALTLAVGEQAVSGNRSPGEITSPCVYSFTVKDNGGKDVELSKYKGDVMLIVNVASK